MKFRLHRKSLAIFVMASHIIGTPAGVGAIERCCDSYFGHDDHSEHPKSHSDHDHHHDVATQQHDEVSESPAVAVGDEAGGQTCGMDHVGIPGLNLKPIQPNFTAYVVSSAEIHGPNVHYKSVSAAPDRAPPNLGQQIYLIQETILQ